MRRAHRTFAIAATAASLSISFAPVVVSAAGGGQPVEVLRLDCAPAVTAASTAIRCEWSAPADPDAAGYRLWRTDTMSGRVRQVIFRTGDVGTTDHLDTAVRRAERYTYVVQAVNAEGRLLGQSRAEVVGVPVPRRVEVMRLACELGAGADVVGCEWSPPTSAAADVVELWRSVDGGARELVERFRPSGVSTYRDRVPEGASSIAYAVLARDADGAIVGRSRAQRVRVPGATPERERPATTVPVTRPVTTVPEPVRDRDRDRTVTTERERDRTTTTTAPVTRPETRPETRPTTTTVPVTRPEPPADQGRQQGAAPETRVGR